MIKEFLQFWKDGFFKLSLLAFLVFGIISLCVMPLLIKQPAFDAFFDLSKGKDVADAINGLASPFIALFASLLTFLAFYVQFKANVEQRRQFKDTLAAQEEDQKERARIWRVERFENHFFELLRLHKANVDEIRLNNEIAGREAFHEMFIRLNILCGHAKSLRSKLIASEGEHIYKKMDELLVTKICYHLFFYGLRRQEYLTFKNYLEGDYLQLFKELSTFFEGHNKLRSAQDGHSRWLGHYYRHLFITCKFILEQKKLFENSSLEEAEKKRYFKILRAQLSNQEQILLYYNAVLWYPEEWKELFVKYKLIKNIPLSLAIMEPKPLDYFKTDIEELFKNGEVLFEAQEKMEQKMYFAFNKTD